MFIQEEVKRVVVYPLLYSFSHKQKQLLPTPCLELILENIFFIGFQKPSHERTFFIKLPGDMGSIMHNFKFIRDGPTYSYWTNNKLYDSENMDHFLIDVSSEPLPFVLPSGADHLEFVEFIQYRDCYKRYNPLFTQDRYDYKQDLKLFIQDRHGYKRDLTLYQELLESFSYHYIKKKLPFAVVFLFQCALIGRLMKKEIQNESKKYMAEEKNTFAKIRIKKEKIKYVFT